MKKILFLLTMFIFANAKSQDTCINDARIYTNTNITANGVRAITGAKLNTSLNKIIDAIDCVGGGVFIATDSNTVINYNVLNSQNAPPVSPIAGDTYLVGTVPTGAWVGHAKDIATWDGSAWTFIDGVQGDYLYNTTNLLTYIYRSGNWVQTGGIPALNNGNTISSGLRIGTNNARSLNFETNNINRGRFDSIGRFHVYNLPTAGSADTFVNVSNTSGQLSKVGKSTFLNGIGGGGGQIAFTKTKAEIDTLIAGNDLVAGAMYEITGVHPTLYNDGTNSGTTIYLKAITENTLEVQGTGKFYNPKYNQAVDGFGIWENKMYGTFSSISGTFDYQNKEAVTANNSATGILLADGMIQYVSGNWSTATSITGGTSGATANVVDFVSPSYAINDKVIWGGYSWKNVNGNIGASTDVLNLNAEWSKNVYDTTNYNIAYDVIEYDYTNDMIIRRYEIESNVDIRCSKVQFDYLVGSYSLNYNPISVQQFGNSFNLSTGKGQLNINVNGGYNESVNFCGAYQLNLTIGQDAYQYDFTFGHNASQGNLTIGQGASQYNITFGYNASQSNLTFGQDAYQYDFTFGQNAYQSYLTFGQNAYQNNLTFGQSANQFNLTFGSNASQYNLTFGSNAYQQYLNFAENTQLNYNNQTLNSNIEYVSFRTKTKVVPNLSAATYIYDGNIKEVYQRPDNALKIRYYDNSDVLQIVDIDD